ncbi:hypothetical protein GCM10018963_63100 [Saccharothrix longispora]
MVAVRHRREVPEPEPVVTPSGEVASTAQQHRMAHQALVEDRVRRASTPSVEAGSRPAIPVDR